MSRLRSVNSDDHGSSTPISQDDLKKVMADQIGGQTWQFPAEDFVRMVCHKERRTDAQIAALKLPDDGFDRTSFYTHASDASAFKSALKQGCQVLELQYASSGIAAQLDKPGLPEEKYYDPLAKLFNLFLKVAREKSGARGSVLSRNGPFSQLAFLEYNRPTADGIAGSAALKPDLVGVTDGNAIAQPGIHKVRAAISLYWSPPEGEHAIHIPFEVKDGWKALLRQAATYARALFNTHPLRTFVLVFGYDQVNHEFRALIFHRGGVSASHACDLSKPTGRAALFTILLALLTCQSEEDVGIPLWCNEQRIKLPARADCSIVDATITKILSSEVVCRGRATRVYRVVFPSSADPTPIPVVTPEQLLPESLLRRSTRFQPVSEGANNEKTSRSENKPKSANMKSNTSAPTSKTRGSTQVWTGAAISPAHNGRDLSELRVGDYSCAENWNVVEGDAVLKSTWAPAGASLEAEILAACSGLFGCPRHYYSFSPINAFGVPATNHLFLPPPDADLDAFHWDIFGNRTTLQPERRALLLILSALVGFSLVHSPTPLDLLGYLHRDVSIGNLLLLTKSAGMKMFDAAPAQLKFLTKTNATVGRRKYDFSNDAGDLMALLEELKVGTDADAFIIDADNAVNWSLFTDPRSESHSGTAEFMSRRLLASRVLQTEYLQSPVDDLHSFFYTTQWAAAFREAERNLPHIMDLRHRLGGNREARSGATEDIRDIVPSAITEERYGPFLSRLAPFLRDWYLKLETTNNEWTKALDALNRQPQADANATRTVLFLTFGYQGVKDFAELVLEHQDELKKYKP